MKNIFKWIVRALTTLIALGVILVIVALVVFDGDKIKTELAEQVKSNTSAELVIKQDLELSFFPWLSIKSGGISLSQPQGFKSELSLAEIAQLKASIKLMPLFSGAVEVGSVELDGLNLNLIRDSKGRSNLEQLTNYVDKAASKAASSESTAEAKEPQETTFSIQKLTLNNVALSQFTANRKHKTTLTQKFSLKHLTLDNFKTDTFIPLVASGELASGSGKTSALWELNTKFKLNKDYTKIELQNLDATINNLSKQIRTLKLDGATSVSLGKDKTHVQHKGNLQLNGQPMDLGFDGGFSRFKDISLSLKTKELDLAPWLQAKSTENASGTEKVDFSPIAAFLKTARIKGDINVGTLKVKNMTFSQVKGKLFNKGTTLWLKPFSANAFKGSLGSTASINFAAKPIALSVQPNLSKIEVGDLLSTIFEVERLSGLGTLDLNMKTKGLDLTQMLKNLSGTGNIDLSDGALNGLDLNKLIESGISLDLMNNKDAYKGKTNFAALAGKIVANKGKIQLNDFAMKSPLFELLGKASTDANKETIGGNFQLVLKGQLKTLLENKYPQLSGQALPLKIKGSWQQPSASIDFESLLKSALQDKLGGKLEDKKKDLEDKLKDKLKDSLFDKLKKGK